MRVLVLGLTVACLRPAAGCVSPLIEEPEPCSDVDGYNGLDVQLEVTGGTLAPGDYAIEATVGGQTLACDAIITADGGLADEPDPLVVDGKHLFLAACWLDPKGGNVVVGYEEGGGPDEVTVAVRSGQVVLAQQTYAPTYVPFDPNGPDCMPHLLVARDSLTVPAP